MKHFSLVILLLAGTVLSAAQLPSFANPKQERKIEVGKPSELVLDSSVHIVLPPRSSQTAAFAAKEIAAILGEVLSAKIEIVPAPKAQGTAISVGDNQYSRKLGIDVAKLDRDGFIIRSKGNLIAIAGRDGSGDPARAGSYYFEHATLYGAYDFLERFAGVRFYFPGRIGTVIPKAKSIRLGRIDLSDRPDHFQRRTLELPGKWYDGKTEKQRLIQEYRRRIQTFYVPCCHSLEQSGYYRRFAKTHPEYFAVDPQGKIYPANHWSVGSGCYLNPGFREQIFLDGCSYLKGESPAVRGMLGGSDRNPLPGFRWSTVVGQPGFFSVMPGDHHRRCCCAKCKAFLDKYGESEYVWDLVASTAERLREAGFKDARVTGMAYARYNTPPKRELPSNLEVMVACTGPWVENLPQLRDANDARVRAWTRKLGRKVWLWNYPSKNSALCELAHYGIPQMAPHAVGNYYKRMAPYTFGAFYEGETELWLFNYLNVYMFYRIAWDNNSDVNALIAEHHKVMFGAAAPEMTRFYEGLEECWIKGMCGKVQETELGPFVVPPANFEVWEKIYSPAKLKAWNALFDAAEKKVSGITLERVQFIRAKFLKELENSSARYFREKSLLAEWICDVAPASKITADGVLNESAWSNYSSVCLLPSNADCCEVKTQVFSCCDRDNLCFAFKCEEPRMKDIVARQTKHDAPDLWTDSEIEVMLYPEKGSRYYQILVNTNGVIGDNEWTIFGGSSQCNAKWESGAKAGVKKTDSGFIIEVAIPKSSIPGFDAASLKANFCRHRALNGAKVRSPYYSWSPNRSGFHDFSNYGKLRFIPKRSLNLVKNGDFTRPFRGSWSPSGNVVIDDRCFVVGGSSAKLSSKGGYTALFESLPLKANTTYAVSFFLKLENVKPVKRGGGFYLLLGDNSNNYFPKGYTYTGTMKWTRQGTLWTTGPQGGSVIPGRSRCIIAVLRDASGSVWIDDIRFEEVKK